MCPVISPSLSWRRALVSSLHGVFVRVSPTFCFSPSISGLPVFYGDVTRPEVLNAFNVGKAKAVICTLADVKGTNTAVVNLRREFPDLSVKTTISQGKEKRAMCVCACAGGFRLRCCCAPKLQLLSRRKTDTSKLIYTSSSTPWRDERRSYLPCSPVRRRKWGANVGYLRVASTEPPRISSHVGMKLKRIERREVSHRKLTKLMIVLLPCLYAHPSARLSASSLLLVLHPQTCN